MAFFPAGEKLGPYELLAPIGAGGMGEVYEARDPRLDRHVAIKVLGPRLVSDPAAHARFRREAMAAAALDHPFICKIFEIGEESGQLYIAMEFVPGQTLHARLAAGPLSTADALRFAGEVAEAIEEAHSKKFVHRDLKPSNIMLTPQGRVKVMDFGLAKRLGDTSVPVDDETMTAQQAELTLDGTVLGTPNYMAPEQVRGEPLDQRSDLFSFGIVLCEMLDSPHPFRKASTADTMAAILREPPDLTGNLAPGLMVLIRRLLAKAPADRYQSMGDVRADLARLAAAPLAAVDDVSQARRLPLIGRDAERAELLRALDQALAGQGSLVMVGGEPGIGKTHLTTAILDEGQRRGCFSVTGHCYDGEGAASYMPFIEILEYSAQVAPRDTFRETLGEAASEVAKLMPELRTRYPDIPPPIQLPPEQQRRYLFNAYRGFVERAARLTPIVAVFEDLHWADEPTLQLLLHMAQTVATVPMLLIGTYRDVELDVARPFADTLETLARQKLATRIALRRLPVGGVEAMLGAMSGQVPPPPLARAIFAATEGVPFFVEEVFRHLVEEGKLFDESGRWIPDLRVDRLEVPEGVRLVIGKRLKRLNEESRRVLTTAAVIGRGFSLGLLETLEAARPDAALEAVEEAERAHLVTAEGGGRDPRYRFVHELIRQTLAEVLSLPRRQRLHARIAEAMERVWAASLDKQAPAIAHHLYQAGAAADPEKTLRYLLRAADLAQRSSAFEDALANLDNAVSLLEGETGLAMADLEERRANVLRSLGRQQEAVAAFEAAISGFLSCGEPVRAASASVPVVWIHGWAGEVGRTERVAQRALDALGERDGRLRARLLSGVSATLAARGRIAEALRTLEEVDAIGVSDADTAVAKGYVCYHAGLIRRGFETAELALRLAQSSGNLWTLVEAENLRMLFQQCAGFPANIAEGERQLKRATVIGNRYVIWSLLARMGFPSWIQGEFQSAVQSMRESIANAESFQIVWRYVDYCALAEIQDTLDEDAAMEDTFRRAYDCEPAQSFGTGMVTALLFRARAMRGDATALDLLRDPRMSMPFPGRPDRQGAYIAAVCAAEGLASLGRPAESAALLPVVEEFLSFGAEYAQLRSTRTAAGIAAACAREWSRSEEHHKAAIHHADTAPARIFQPMSREWYAAMLAARGDAGRARPMLAEALALYETIGMPGYARRASERLAAMAR